MIQRDYLNAHKLKLKLKNPKILQQRLVLALLISVLTVGLIGPGFAEADNYDAQINRLRNQNEKKEDQQSVLLNEAASFQDKINGLRAQIRMLESQIRVDQSRSDELRAKITAREREMDTQKDLLGQNIRKMYTEGDISTLEMLASSKDLSEFVDKEQYRNSVKDKIKETLDKVNALKLELATQRDKVEKLIKEQEQLRGQIAAQKSEQTRLLNMNQAQQAAFEREIKSNQNKIAELRRQQVLENIRLFGSSGGITGGGGYPWGRAKCLHTGQVEGWCANYDWAVNGSVWNWTTGGYGYRNCTDWVAYRVRVAGGNVPSGLGNANTWDNRAPSYGYTVSSRPRKGAAAVSNSGYYGHVMYVEAVNGDGSIVVSDYNRAGTGKYDVTTLSAGTASSLVYVYF